MVMWALESIPFIALPKRKVQTKFTVQTKDLVFISLEQHEKEYAITSKLKKAVAPDITVLLIPEVTRGAVETVLAAKKFINTTDELIISDCDHYFDGDSLYKTILHRDNLTIGIIPVFQPPDKDPKWSYTLFDTDKTAIAVGEKDAKLAASGAYANIGAYYFSEGKIFVEEAEKMINDNDMYGNPGKEEFYVAPLYQRLIKKGMKVKAAVTPTVWGLGTPKDVELFTKEFTD